MRPNVIQDTGYESEFGDLRLYKFVQKDSTSGCCISDCKVYESIEFARESRHSAIRYMRQKLRVSISHCYFVLNCLISAQRNS